MPKFFFDCSDGKRFHRDLHGIELKGNEEVADHAAALAHELLGECTESVGTHAVSVMVRCAAGVQVYVAHAGFHGMLVPLLV